MGYLQVRTQEDYHQLATKTASGIPLASKGSRSQRNCHQLRSRRPPPEQRRRQSGHRREETARSDERREERNLGDLVRNLFIYCRRISCRNNEHRACTVGPSQPLEPLAGTFVASTLARLRFEQGCIGAHNLQELVRDIVPKELRNVQQATNPQFPSPRLSEKTFSELFSSRLSPTSQLPRNRR